MRKSWLGCAAVLVTCGTTISGCGEVKTNGAGGYSAAGTSRNSAVADYGINPRSVGQAKPPNMTVQGIPSVVGRQGSHAPNSHQVVLGLSVPNTIQPFFHTLVQGVKVEAAAYGAKVTVMDANNQAVKQNQQVQVLVQQRVQALIIAPLDSKGMGFGVKLANQVHMPVVTVDGRIVSHGHLAAEVSSANMHIGMMAGHELVQGMGGKGEVIVMEGNRATSTERDRTKGFIAELRMNPQIKQVGKYVANYSRAEAKNEMHKALLQHPDVQGVFAENDEMALGVLDALHGRVGKLPLVVGVDGQRAAVAAVQRGEMYADIAQDPLLQGKVAVQRAIDAQQGRTPNTIDECPIQVIVKGSSYRGY